MTIITTIGPDGQYELRQQQATPKLQLIRTAEELVRTLENEPQCVAWSMLWICRFGGQVPGCDVLGHSLRVHETLPSVSSYSARIWALLHDCHEIITGDLVRPYKSARLTRAQTEIDAVLQSRFCPSITPEDIELVRLTDVAVGDGELQAWERYKPLYQRSVSEWVTLFRELQQKS